MDVCKCRQNPLPEQIEFKIEDSFPLIEISKESVEDFGNIDKLKEKIICDLNHILDQLECGIQPNLEIILEEISLVNIYGK